MKCVSWILSRKDFLCSGRNSQWEKTYFTVSNILMIKPSMISAVEGILDSLSQLNIFPVTSEYFNHGLTMSQALTSFLPRAAYWGFAKMLFVTFVTWNEREKMSQMLNFFLIKTLQYASQQERLGNCHFPTPVLLSWHQAQLALDNTTLV